MTSNATHRILVLGVGNTLLQDDGVGIRVTQHLIENGHCGEGVECMDGGTLGLSLLPAVEDADALIFVDAAELGAAPGTVQVFEHDAFDRQLTGIKRTVHEVAIGDLISAAKLRGRCPRRRALVAIQPACTDWGLEPTTAVAAAISRACEAVGELTRRYRDEA